MTLPPLRAWVLVILSSLALLIVCHFYFGRLGLAVGLLASLGWSYGMLLLKHKSATEHYKGIPMEGRDPWGLLEKNKSISVKMGLTVPDLFLVPSKHPLFLISISQWNRPQILFSHGLLRMLTSEETEALMTLAIVSLKNRRNFFTYTLDRMSLTWISLGRSLDQLLGLGSLSLFSSLCYGIAWVHLKFAFSQGLQLQSDLETAQYLKNPRPLASALWKIQGYLNNHPLQPGSVYRHESLLGAPQKRRTAAQFILPIEHRLRSLVGYYPI